jgi:flagellar biosynthesis protein FlhB
MIFVESRQIEMVREEQNRYTTYLLPYNLQYFANEGGDKTEEPTAKKLNDARGEGQVARSTELITASGLATLFIILKLFSGFMGNRFVQEYKKAFQNIDKLAKDEFSVATFQGLFSDAITSIIFTCLPIFATAIFVSVTVILFQVKWKISGKIIKPKLSKINPVNGFKRIINKDKIVELFIELIKIAIIIYVAYSSLKDDWRILFILYNMKLEQAIIFIGNFVIDLGLKISMIFLVIGFGDLIYQKIKFRIDMRMTKQEVKDEYKNTEGDPQIKSKIRARMREISMKRMMQSIPQADVVITNPTHFAAAIKYDKSTSEAPVLLAKGADYLAQRIKDIAKENKIEIVENKPLARMLYYNVEIGDEIPPELYQMTAEVLAYVYGLKIK